MGGVVLITEDVESIFQLKVVNLYVILIMLKAVDLMMCIIRTILIEEMRWVAFWN